MAGNDASSVPAALASTLMAGEISLKERLMRLSGWRHLYSGFDTLVRRHRPTDITQV